MVSLYHFHRVMWRLTCLSIVFWSSRTRATSESGSMAPLDRRCVQKTSHNVTLITTIPGTHKNKGGGGEKNLKWINNYYCVINNSASKFSKTAITNNIWIWMSFPYLPIFENNNINLQLYISWKKVKHNWQVTLRCTYDGTFLDGTMQVVNPSETKNM